MNPDDHLALTEREALIEQRAQAVLDRARTEKQPWLAGLPEPHDPAQAEALRVIAAYRDRWQITARSPLGPTPDNDAQRLDHERAKAHLDAIQANLDDTTEPTQPSKGAGRDAPGI